jgi:hypothetical protein
MAVVRKFKVLEKHISQIGGPKAQTQLLILHNIKSGYCKVRVMVLHPLRKLLALLQAQNLPRVLPLVQNQPQAL